MGVLTSIIDPNWKLPGAFLKVTLGVGPRSPASGAMKILLLALKTSAGTAAVGELKPLTGPDDGKTYGGPGSEYHLMAKALFAANKTATVYAVAMDGTGGTAGTKALAFTGTATADGGIEVWILGERAYASITNGMTATQVGDAVAAAINARTDFPVTAANATGTVTLTAKNTGVRSAAISCRSLASVAGITHTAATGYLSAGTAGTENATTQLDAVGSQRFHLVVSPHFDSTNLLKFKAFASSQSGPIPGKRCQWVSCFSGTGAAFITLSDAVNDPRGIILHYENPDDTPAMIAAAAAGAIARECSANRAKNTDGAELPGIKTQYSIADIPSGPEQNAILSNGGTPLLGAEGVVRIVRLVTNYHQDASGNDDTSILDAHKVMVCDFLADLVEFNFSTTFRGFNIAPDGEDGVPPAAKVATPKSARDWIFGQLKSQENRLIVNVDANADALVVEIDDDVDGRMNAEIPADVIEHFHQLGANVSQIG